MGLFDKNLGETEGLMWAASGFVAMVIGLFIFVNDPLGVVIALVGLIAVLFGYYRCNPFKAFSNRR